MSNSEAPVMLFCSKRRDVCFRVRKLFPG